jgi:hypothetical protein
VAVFVNTFFEKRVERIFDLAERVEEAFSSAGLEYRIVGGLATYLYVEELEPDAGRLTRDIDIAVRREDLRKIAEAVEPFGLHYRHVAGVTCWRRPANRQPGGPFTWFSPARRSARNTRKQRPN